MTTPPFRTKGGTRQIITPYQGGAYMPQGCMRAACISHTSRSAGMVAPAGLCRHAEVDVGNVDRAVLADGKFLFDWGTKGTAPGEFDLPHGIAMDARGRLYVADRANGRVQVFDPNGKFLDQWKSPELGRPWGMTVDADGFLYLIDGGDLNPKPPDRGRVLKMTLEGEILEEWGSFGSYDGQFYWAHDVGVGKDGAVYVVDVHLGMRVQKFVRK